MNKKNLFSMSLLCIALTGIVSCDKQDNSTTSVTPASADSGHGGQQQAELEIVGYGPQGTEAGKSFNAQSSGESALWVKLNHPAAGSKAAIWWGSHRLDSSVSGDVISALVPAELYANAGRVPLQVHVTGGSSPEDKSTIVYFVVK